MNLNYLHKKYHDNLENIYLLTYLWTNLSIIRFKKKWHFSLLYLPKILYNGALSLMNIFYDIQETEYLILTILPVFVFTLVSDSLCPRILKFGTFIELSSTEELPPFQKNLQVNVCKWMNVIAFSNLNVAIIVCNNRHLFHN